MQAESSTMTTQRGRTKSIRLKADDDVKDIKDNNNSQKPTSKVQKRVNKDLRKLLTSSVDPFDTPLAWWETEHVKYAINYPPVKSRLEKVMGSHVVRLTDRKYMEKLAANFQKYHQEQQKIRIQRRNLAPPSVISRLLEVSYKTLAQDLTTNKRTIVKLYTSV